MLAVTSFHPAGYKQYGKRCLEGLADFFPGNIVAYVEEETPFEHQKVEIRDFFSIKGTKEFLERIKRVSGSDGWGNAEYDYRFDASKFCRKVFAQDAVFDESDLVFWVDADCVIKQQIPESVLREMLDDVALAYMGRGREDSYLAYTESGFVGFNTKHPRFKEFRAKYLSCFTTGKVFQQLRGWHDCIVFDLARKGIPGRNLSPKGTGMEPVIDKTVLAPYMDHLKGARKDKE